MSETSIDSALPPPAAAPAPATRAPSHGARTGSGFALLLALLALGAAAYLLWRDFEFSRTYGSTVEAAGEHARDQAKRIATLERELDTTGQATRTHERKLADAENLNRSLREEVLGLGERAALLEDAVASLADRRLSGAVVLKLDEASFLLRLGAERLALFDDPRSTIIAFRLADAQLAELDDPLLAGVRQTIAAEIQSLAELPALDTAGLAARIDAVIDALPKLPTRLEQSARIASDTTGAGYGARLAAVLGQFVRVRRLDSADAALVNPLNAQALRAALALELQLAKAALAAGDAERFQAAIRHARARIAQGFAPGATSVREALATLDSILSAPAAQDTPPVGRALEELSNLRATRALTDGVKPAETEPAESSESSAPADSPAAPPPPAAATDSPPVVEPDDASDRP